MQDHITFSTFEFFEIFPDEEEARLYLEEQRWGWDHQPVCPYCGCFDSITTRKGKRLGYYRCRDCDIEFTVRTGTIFERSHVPLKKWLYAIYLLVTARKGVSSLQLSKELSVTQKTAWFMLGRLREACKGDLSKLQGIVEVDEAYIGGKEGNKHASKKLRLGRGTVGKQALLGMRERGGKTIAKPISGPDKRTLRREIARHIKRGSTIHTDEHKGYTGIGSRYEHKRVNHSKGEFVGPDDTHTNSIESVWAVFKRSVHGTWHHVSAKHLARYAAEATFRLNDGNVKIHTLDRMNSFVRYAFRRRITYKKLIS